MPERPIGRAVVVGASMAGLLAARVLCDVAEEVVVVERDRLPETAAHRRGVPQARHTHVLHPRGLQTLEGLFPGIAAALGDAGAVVLDDLAQLSFSALGRLFSRGPRPRPMVLLATRDLVEHQVRSRVLQLDRLRLHEETEVAGLCLHDGRVTGVRLVEPAAALDADLVVVASGRTGRLEAWLEAVDRPAPRETRQPVEVRYATQPLSLTDGAVPERLVVVGPRPGRPIGFYLAHNEGGLRLCTVMGYGAAGPAARREDLLAIATELAAPYVADAVRRAEPLGPVAGYRFPANRRLRVGGVLPEALVVVGDALCAFNPIYGQGMTVAACQAVALGEALASGPHGAERRYHLAADRIADQAWEVSVPADRTVLGVPRSLRERVEQRYLGRLLDRATWDVDTAADVLDVLTMSRPKQALLHPAAVGRALRPRVPAA